jgi:peptidoglycan/xylan/chitin deacetylase (PgdA/CDA1 family)
MAGSVMSTRNGIRNMRFRFPRVLMYHAVCPSTGNPNDIFTAPGLFEAQMRYLKRHNLRGVSIRELNRAMSVGNAKYLVGLTFDDGYEHLLDSALPVLERYGFSATVFVVVGKLGKDNDWEFYYDPRPRMKLLEAAGVRQLMERGMEVGSHSMSHTRLSAANPERLEEEVYGSRQVLSEVLGEAVDGFSYPYGAIDSASIKAVRRAQYAYACATIRRVERNAFDLPRITVAEDSPLKFATKLKIYPQYALAKSIYSRYVRSTDLTWQQTGTDDRRG